MFNGLTHHDLERILRGVEPTTLIGITLIQQAGPRPHTGNRFDIDVPSDVLEEAREELRDYATLADTARTKLAKLPVLALMSDANADFIL